MSEEKKQTPTYLQLVEKAVDNARKYKPLRWTTEKPTKPGYYWVQWPFLGGPMVEEVWARALARAPNLFIEDRDGVSRPVSECTATHFAGPIPEPEGE